MGVLKGVGKVAGGAFGAVVGGATYLAGSVVNSKLIQEVGEGVFNSSMKAGETAGGFADGAISAAAGTALGDQTLQRRGCKEMGDAVVETAVGVGKGVVHVWNNGKLAVEGVATGDTDKALKGGAELLKTAAIATLAIGVLDIVDVADGPNTTGVGLAETVTDSPHDVGAADSDAVRVENPNTHFVHAHPRVLPSGETIWVDGAGDTSVATQPGWTQDNPGYRVKT